MTCDEFILLYWKHYISLEKEFLSCVEYVEIDDINYNTYSVNYSKLLLEICSEIDVVLKMYCKMLDSSFNKRNIKGYHDLILQERPNMINEKIKVINKNIDLLPFIEWITPNQNPTWWNVYNKIKHERTSKIMVNGVKMESYKFGNLFNVINALSGLYEILILMYSELANNENRRIKTPLPGSRVFVLGGNIGNTLTFYDNDAFYVEDGHLIWERGDFFY